MVNEVLLAVPRHAATPRGVAPPAEVWRRGPDAGVPGSSPRGWPPARYQAAATPRGVARPAEVWRLCQDAVVQASSQQGWPPERYQAAGNSFVLARMVTHHHQELSVGVPLCARTWVRAFHRQTLCDREVVLHTAEGAVAVTAAQRWAHVSAAELRLTRAPEDLIAAFPLCRLSDVPALPSALAPLPAASGDTWTLAFRCWHTWLDPLRHVNHPTYLEWCDESLMQRLAAAGVAPERLQPVAEEVHYRQSIMGDDPVEVRSTLAGVDGAGQVVSIRHTIAHPDSGMVYAVATTVRRLVGGGTPTLAALLGYSSAAVEPSA